MPLVEGKEIPERDAGPILDELKSKFGGNKISAGTIVFVTTTKFLCPNHPMRTVINMEENNFRHKRNKMKEFECSCGVVYKKKQ